MANSFEMKNCPDLKKCPDSVLMLTMCPVVPTAVTSSKRQSESSKWVHVLIGFK